jgi:drug/metabolite transporter (DMT)-like permease
MSPWVLGLLLASAAMHASWNALLRSGADRLWSMAVMTSGAALVALPLALAGPAPHPDSWPCLALSALLQVGYCLLLVRAYRHGDLGQVYPIARGSSPLLVTLGAALLAGERLGMLQLGGIALISCGILGFALGRGRLDPTSLRAALATGVFISAYTVTDGLGARASGAPTSYAAWLFVCQGAPMPFVYMTLRGRFRVDPFALETRKALAGGVVSMVAYGIVVWAMSHSPMGATSALRETSILFAALLGRAFLGEPLTLARLGAAAAISAGAACLALGR